MKMTSPAELRNRKLIRNRRLIRITGTGPESRSRLSRKHHSSEGCATVWGGAEMREGPEWRRREIGGRPEIRGSTRGGPEMNRKTGNGPEMNRKYGNGPEGRSNEEEDIRGY
ncbi:hypothetical protein B0H10DRAFT_2187725 [Mycena sp. CBHHK59/15]|nr:hypothetical protein B0H10DRAFT_2187725 [Mycena sp. CBHHK59/15]